MTLAQAFALSNVAVYQEVARRGGLVDMQVRVRALGYGSAQVGEAVDRFWLDGPLAISAVEQVLFLDRLLRGELPVTERALVQLREMALVERGDGYRLYGKTGWSTATEPGVGWWVGWLEQGDQRAVFALNMPMHEVAEAPRRLALVRAALQALDKLPARAEDACCATAPVQ